MGEQWIEILRQQAAAKGQAAVAREIGYSPAVVSQVLSGTYRGNLERVAARVAAMYGTRGRVRCPELGEIDPARCADHWERAGRIGIRAGNPRTKRLYARCRRCPVRG